MADELATPPAGDAARHRFGRTGLVCLGMLGLTLVAFGGIVRHDFVAFDDDVLITDNPGFHPVTLAHVLRYARGPYYGGAFPLAYATLAALATVDHHADGRIAAWPFHVASLVLHAGCACLVFLVLRRLFRADRPAALGAAVFAVHPLHVETVAWATNVNTLLHAILFLLALWLYLVYASQASSAADAAPRTLIRRQPLFAAATAAFVLAMLAKPVAVTLPMVAAALDLGILRRPWRDVIRPIVLWLALAAPFVMVTRLMLATPEVLTPPLWVRPLIALDAIAFYLAKIALPLNLSPDYGRTPRWLLASPALYLTWLVPVVLGVALFLARRTAPLLLVAAVVFLAPLLPVLGLTPFHFQYLSTVADRYPYVPMLGACMVVAWGALRWPRPAAYVVCAWVVVLALGSRAQARHWRDTESLFAMTLRRNPDSLAAHNHLGIAAVKRGDAEVALAHYRAALRNDPTHPTTLYNLGNVLRAGGRFEQAVAAYEAALVRAPGNARIRSNLGVALAEQGRLEEAEAQLRQAIKHTPQSADAHANLGKVLAMQNRHAEAVPHYREALRIQPNFPMARAGLDQSLAATGPSNSGKAQ